jgi:hypothetical protein
MAISKYVQDNEKKKFKESSSVAGQPGVVVLNPDGSSISGGSGASAPQVQGTTAIGSASLGNPVYVGAIYETSPTVLTNGQRAALHTDVNQNLLVSLNTLIFGEDSANNLMATQNKPVASSTYTGTSFIAVLNDVDISVKGSAGNLLSITCTNINAAIRYLQIHNKASAPASGETAILSFPIPAGTSTAPATVSVGRDFFGQHGHYFSTGIAVGVSTAAATFTAATTTDHVVNGTFV